MLGTVGPCFAPLPQLGAVRLRGRDALKVLHSLTTQHGSALVADNVSPLAGGPGQAGECPRRSGYFAWLTSKGRVLFETLAFLESSAQSVAQSAGMGVQTPANSAPASAAAKAAAMAAPSVGEVSLLLVLPRPEAGRLVRHIKANTLRAQAAVSVASDVALWSVMLPPHLASRGPGPEETADAAAGAALARATASADRLQTALAGAGGARVFVDPRLRNPFFTPPTSAMAGARAADSLALPQHLLVVERLGSPSASASASPVEGTLRGLGLERVPPAVYEVFRAVAGWPVAAHAPYPLASASPSSPSPSAGPALWPELPAEKSLPLEGGLLELGAVHLHKGCYVGQELTARTHFQGLVRKRVFPALLRAHPPGAVPPTELVAARAALDSAKKEGGAAERGLVSEIPIVALARASVVRQPAARPAETSGGPAMSPLFPRAPVMPFSFLAECPIPAADDVAAEAVEPGKPGPLAGLGLEGEAIYMAGPAEPTPEGGAEKGQTALTSYVEVGKVLSTSPLAPVGMVMLRVAEGVRPTGPFLVRPRRGRSAGLATEAQGTAEAASLLVDAVQVRPLCPDWLLPVVPGVSEAPPALEAGEG